MFPVLCGEWIEFGGIKVGLKVWFFWVRSFGLFLESVLYGAWGWRVWCCGCGVLY